MLFNPLLLKDNPINFVHFSLSLQWNVDTHIAISLGVEVSDVVTSKVVSAVYEDCVERVIGRGFLGLLEKTVQIEVFGELIPADARSVVTISCVHNKAKQTSQLHLGQLFFSKEKELPWEGFEPTTLCSLGGCSTNSYTHSNRVAATS